MTTQIVLPDADIRAKVRELFDAFNAHDVDRIVKLHTKSAVFDDPTLIEPAHGHEALGAELRRMFQAFPDITFTVKDVYVAEAGHVAAHWEFTATMTGPIDPPGYAPTGKTVTVDGACVYEMKDGLFSRHTSIYDTMGLLQQLGLMPGLDSPTVKIGAGIQRAMSLVTKAVQRH
jgi:steroid delta-isomerase-like uncharacterized protein